jgi:hypothetical protein
VNAGVSSGGALPTAPPPESYTLKDMTRFLRSFSSDQRVQDNREFGHDSQIKNILSDMDGSCGWVRLNRDDINNLVRRWDLDLGYAMNGRYFQESSFGIVKKYVRSGDALDNVKLSK